MKANTIVSISNIAELKALGSYSELKNTLEDELDSKLGVNGWDSLCERIQSLKVYAREHRDELLSENPTLNTSEQEIIQLLNLKKVEVEERGELKKKIHRFIKVFDSTAIDPYKHYEKTRLEKFKYSSRLEGIDVQITDESKSLESVLAKYRR